MIGGTAFLREYLTSPIWWDGHFFFFSSERLTESLVRDVKTGEVIVKSIVQRYKVKLRKLGA